MGGFRGAPWQVKIEEPDYLDGIRSGVTVQRLDGGPVAYAFDEQEGRLLAAAPGLLAALRVCRKELAVVRDGSVGGVPNSIVALIPEAIAAADAALSLATGEA